VSAWKSHDGGNHKGKMLMVEDDDDDDDDDRLLVNKGPA